MCRRPSGDAGSLYVTLWESSDVRSILGDDCRDRVCAQLTIRHRNGQNVAHFLGA